MKKVEWWQWALGALVIAVVVGSNPPRAPDKSGIAFAEPAAKFETIAGDSIFAMTFNAKADPQVLPELAREQCGKLPRCQVVAWTDAKYAARGFPMTNREAAALAFSYSLNRSTGFEKVIWDCRRWKRASADECMAATN